MNPFSGNALCFGEWKLNLTRDILEGKISTDKKSTNGIVISPSINFGRYPVETRDLEENDIINRIENAIDSELVSGEDGVTLLEYGVEKHEIEEDLFDKYVITNTSFIPVHLWAMVIFPDNHDLFKVYIDDQNECNPEESTMLNRMILPGQSVKLDVICSLHEQKYEVSVNTQYCAFVFHQAISPIEFRQFVIVRKHFFSRYNPDIKLSPEAFPWVDQRIKSHLIDLQVDIVQNKTFRPMLTYSQHHYKPLSSIIPQKLLIAFKQFGKQAVEQCITELFGPSHDQPFVYRKIIMTKLLSFVEALQEEKDMEQFYLYWTKIEPTKRLQRNWPFQKVNFFSIKVPGVGERKPPLDVGDYFVISLDSIGIQRYIYDIVGSDVIFAVFDQEKSFIHPAMFNKPVHVKFLYQSERLHLINECLDNTLKEVQQNSIPYIKQMLFPEVTQADLVSPPPIDIDYIDNELNMEQRLAVQRVLAFERSKVPTIVFGPPGTGKTRTVVEIILQLTRMGKRVLCCTPSDYSADVVAERLVPFMKQRPNMIRLNEPKRYSSVKPELREFCYYAIGNTYSVPAMDDIQKSAVIVTTCLAAGLLLKNCRRSNLFDYLVFDESSQALEAEMFIPLSLINEKTRLVLAGDHKQLGPNVLTSVAVERHYGISLQERLMRFPFYHYRDCARHMILLRRNYRSHELLLKVSSELYYDNLLIPCVDNRIAYQMLDFKELPNPRIPLMFIDTPCEDYYEVESKSYENRGEALKVAEIVRRIIDAKISNITVESIGVIAPYRRQVLSIRRILRTLGYGRVRVGTVEDYQGREETIVILSTVLSPKRHEDPAGVVVNQKRFNVAITRAKSLLVVIGNSMTLEREAHWQRFLVHCRRYGCYLGENQDFQNTSMNNQFGNSNW